MIIAKKKKKNQKCVWDERLLDKRSFSNANLITGILYKVWLTVFFSFKTQSSLFSF